MSTHRLEQWGVIPTSPHLNVAITGGIRLVGFRDQDNSVQVITSPITKVSGRECTTASGNVYVLGEIQGDYLQVILANGVAFDPEHPIKNAQTLPHVRA